MVGMRSKCRFSRLLVIMTILAVAGWVSEVLIEIALAAAAQAEFSGDLVGSGRTHSQSDKFFQNRFDSWKGQKRKLQRPSRGSRLSQQHRTKSKPEHNTTILETPKARAAGTAIATIQNVPLPRPRPPTWPEPHSFAEAAGPDFNSTDITSTPSDCDQRLASMAVIELLPRLIGPGECGGRDMVELDAVRLPNHRHIEIRPSAILRCAMAESFAAWIRDEASPQVATLDTTLYGVETYGSYECRGRNGVPGAKLSEHGKGNAIDVRAFVLARGHRTELTDMTLAKSFREDLRDSACRRFTTVLGPGADGYHDSHIHLDILDRSHGHRLCQWDVRERNNQIASAHVQLATTSPPALGQPRDDQTVTVGPWAIATNYRANKFESCTMSRSEGELGITFARIHDGLFLIIDSSKWKLERGKSYPVRLSAGSRSVGAKAMADAKSVTIALIDTRFNSKLRSLGALEVRGEGDTLRVPLDGSSAAFERLEECFKKTEASKTNPFVRGKDLRTNPFVAPNTRR